MSNFDTALTYLFVFGFGLLFGGGETTGIGFVV